MHRLARHIQHYVPLFGLLAAGILGFYIFSYDRAFQAVISVALATSYVSWGIIHHYIHKDLNLTVISEYVVIALLGLIMVFSVLFRV